MGVNRDDREEKYVRPMMITLKMAEPSSSIYSRRVVDRVSEFPGLLDDC